jgi:hypothetical protein
MVFIAEANRIIPATINAAPASKLKPELESFIESHTKMPRVIAAPEINISRTCALRIRMRGGLNAIGVCRAQHVFCTLWLYNSCDTITTRLARYFLTTVSRGIDTVFTHRRSSSRLIIRFSTLCFGKEPVSIAEHDRWRETNEKTKGR